ncbi:MAG: CYTH domain-containing protein [Burkholderiaceae bacterium]|nr:CYTH domain-containing protein [Burkholderiaceae bacterium]
MGREIERKFLVQGEDWKQGAAVTPMRQGYLSTDPERVVRVRIEGDRAVLTIKGKSVGAVRGEWEYDIPKADAEELLALCPRPLIEKSRYRIAHAGMLWEVDEFFGDNAGLVVAEIELQSEDQAFDKPHWVGAEVTQDARYYNSNLLRHPYKDW